VKDENECGISKGSFGASESPQQAAMSHFQKRGVTSSHLNQRMT
jgi:hypothetical protein